MVVGRDSDVGGGASIMGTLSGGGTEVISVGERCLLGANAGIGIALGDDCVVEAGLYVTAATKVTLPGGNVVKARTLSGSNALLFLRNSVTGRSRSGDAKAAGSRSTPTCTRTDQVASLERPERSAFSSSRWPCWRRSVSEPSTCARAGADQAIPGQERCVATANDQSVAVDLDQAHYASIIVGLVRAACRRAPPRSRWPRSTRRPGSAT